MKPLLIDKVASAAANCRLGREVRISSNVRAVEGSVVAVRVLNSKSTYNQLELPSGRMSQIKPGDVIAGVLGHRKALFGYSGTVPPAVTPGDVLNLLNIGGVIGLCDSINPALGEPFRVEVLGQVLAFPYTGERIGVPAHVSQHALPLSEKLETRGIPVIAVVGTCMNAGKTFAACALTQALVHRGFRVAAGKATGVTLRRDVLAMEDAGAVQTLLFSDLGVVTTTAEQAPAIARTLVTRLAAATQRPDVIVLELGDGLMGLYGVSAILNDAEFVACLRATVLAANDPVGAWGGVRLLRERHGIEPSVVTGPATDNTAGTRLIEAETGIVSRNARTQADELADLVLAQAGLPARGAVAPAPAVSA